MVRVVSQWWNNAAQTVNNWGRHIGQTAQNIWQTVSNHANIMGQMVQKASQHMGNVARTIGGWASGLYNNASTAFQGVVNGAVNQNLPKSRAVSATWRAASTTQYAG